MNKKRKMQIMFIIMKKLKKRKRLKRQPNSRIISVQINKRLKMLKEKVDMAT